MACHVEGHGTPSRPSWHAAFPIVARRVGSARHSGWRKHGFMLAQAYDEGPPDDDRRALANKELPEIIGQGIYLITLRRPTT